MWRYSTMECVATTISYHSLLNYMYEKRTTGKNKPWNRNETEKKRIFLLSCRIRKVAFIFFFLFCSNAIAKLRLLPKSTRVFDNICRVLSPMFLFLRLLPLPLPPSHLSLSYSSFCLSLLLPSPNVIAISSTRSTVDVDVWIPMTLQTIISSRHFFLLSFSVICSHSTMRYAYTHTHVSCTMGLCVPNTIDNEYANRPRKSYYSIYRWVRLCRMSSLWVLCVSVDSEITHRNWNTFSEWRLSK